MKTSDTVLRKIYLSLYLKRFVCERELETEQNCSILTPNLMGISLSFPFSRVLNRRPGGLLCWVPASSTASFHQWVWSPKQTDFLSSLSYIIVPLPPQSLEWHVWSSSSGNNCHAVHSHSLPVHQSMTVPRDFILSHIVSQARQRDFFP